MEQSRKKSPVRRQKSPEAIEIGDNIRTMRMKKGWTQSELAERMEADSRLISRHENGDVEMNLKALFKYADAFDCPVLALLPKKYQRIDADGLTPEMKRCFLGICFLPKEKQNSLAKIFLDVIQVSESQP